MYAIVVDYYCWSEEKGEHEEPMYLGVAYPPKNIFVFDKEHKSRSYRWENKTEAEEFLRKFKEKKINCCSFENARIEEVEICTK